MIDHQNARERMLQAAKELLDIEPDVKRVTVRQIAERAGVGVGSIHYHFGSKDALLAAALEYNITETIENFMQAERAHPDPVERLKVLLRTLFNVSPLQQKSTRFLLQQRILQGDMQVSMYIVRLLREVYGEQKEERALRLVALQILNPLQLAAISPAAFRRYSGVELYDTRARNQLIDQLVDNVLTKA